MATPSESPATAAPSAVTVTYQGEPFHTTAGTTVAALLPRLPPCASTPLIARLDGKLCDLSAAITADTRLELLTYDDPEGREAFWHSGAHVLGRALQNLYGCKLVNGPPVAEGFYYDVDSAKPISSDDFDAIREEMLRLAAENTPFTRDTLSKDALLALYNDNPFKQYFINKNVATESTVYRNGPFFDLCLGPHIPSTGLIRDVRITKTGSAYFLNDAAQPALQRIYAIAFPSEALASEYDRCKQLARERDHRNIGREMNLFFFHKYSAGSCFWLPDGTRIYNKLVDFLRSEYRRRGFREVITPNIFSVDLWRESGHYDNYRENIFMLKDEDLAMKPMNCPAHCLMFGSTERSFRELPLRFADFGVLHRNELSGALTGLTRVRRFQQDDAHIFCTHAQLREEIAGCLDFLQHVYGIFGFSYELRLSTRPEKFIGSTDEWDAAEDALRAALGEAGIAFEENPGDGAFYGPKIDIVLRDAADRRIQCATIQLDFQLPQRFKLNYTESDGLEHRPIIIHRAILGSIERMIAILLEQYGKRLPLWLTPRQVAFVPVKDAAYAQRLAGELMDYDVRVFDDAGLSLNKKILRAETDGFRLICVVGDKEESAETVSLRFGGSNARRVLPFASFKRLLAAVVEEKAEFPMEDELTARLNALSVE